MPIDTSAITAPKRRNANPSPRKATVATASVDTRSQREKRVEGLDGLAQTAQGVLLITGQFADAAAIGKYAPAITNELATLADTNDTIASVADFLVKTGPYTALITAVMPLALQIAANHKLLNAASLSGFGVVSPELLEAQMKAEVMRQQAEAMRMQQEAQEEMNRVMAELQAANNVPAESEAA